LILGAHRPDQVCIIHARRRTTVQLYDAVKNVIPDTRLRDVIYPARTSMIDSSEEIAKDVLAIGRINSVPTLLQVLCETTGMRFAAVARVTDCTWTACAVHDDINFGLVPGGQLDVSTTLCAEVRQSRTPIVIEEASSDPRYCNHHTPRLYKIESYVSVPIVLADGSYFGNLCAIDPAPAKVSDPRVVSMFNRFAELIAQNLENDAARNSAVSALLDERAASELREQFIAILGHDLRNPLAAVAMTGEVLLRRLTDPELVALASRIKTNARRMSALIDDVLDFARARLGGGIGIRMNEVHHLETALTAVVRELQDAQPGRTITTDLQVPGRIICDIDRIQQLASNLLSNALTHGSADRPVTIKAIVESDELVLSVWNDGEPIPQNNIGKIFAPFWRRSTAANRHGLGLGLHICSQIVHAHKGTIGVTSSRERGTEFTVRLPSNATGA
jgi:signal transduction histidine kinase